LMPGILGGLGAAEAIHGQSMYANEYNTYCGTGLQIGIPCNAPSALTGTFGGGLGSMVYGGGGYGFSLGGMSMGMSGIGMASPYGFAGMSYAGMSMASGIGIGSAIGMASPYSFAGMS